MKVSMHAISMGILVSFIALMGVTQPVSFTPYLSVALFVAGLVCTSRLILSDHNQKEIYIGLLLGLISMLAGIWAHGFLP